MRFVSARRFYQWLALELPCFRSKNQYLRMFTFSFLIATVKNFYLMLAECPVNIL